MIKAVLRTLRVLGKSVLPCFLVRSCDEEHRRISIVVGPSIAFLDKTVHHLGGRFLQKLLRRHPPSLIFRFGPQFT